MNNSRKGKKNKSTPGYGLPDYYKYYSDTYKDIEDYKLTKKQYRAIICLFHKLIIHEIIYNGLEYDLPQRLGRLGIRKFKPKLKIENNRLINHNAPDFQATKKLWERNLEAKEKKILVRHVNKHTKGYVFTLKYFTYFAHYKNKRVYKFRPTRQVKKLITKATKETKLDALIL